MKKKTFDAVTFMRRGREELSRAYAGLTAEQMEERIQESLKNDPLWKTPPHGKAPGKQIVMLSVLLECEECMPDPMSP